MTGIKAAIIAAGIMIFAATCTYAAGDPWDVSPKYGWSPDKLHSMAKKLADSSPYLSYELIGSSVEGREIYALTLSDDADVQTKSENMKDFSLTHNHTLFIAGTHSKEHMNPYMLFQMVENYVRDVDDDSAVGGYSVRRMLFEEKQALHFVVCLNPDGVNYVKKRGNVSSGYRGKFGSGSMLKANMNGIDLNRNFPHTVYDAALDTWYKLANNSRLRPSKPGERNYGGRAGSEPETRALMGYIVRYPYKAMISFHSYGRVQYAGHRYVENETYTHAKKLSAMIRSVSGYRNDESIRITNAGSSRGFETEYFTIMSGKPSITVETNSGESTRYAYAKETSSRKLWKIPLETARISKSFKSGPYKLYKDSYFFTSFASGAYAAAYAERYGLDLVAYSGSAVDFALATDSTPPVIRIAKDGSFIDNPSAASITGGVRLSVDDPNLSGVVITKDGSSIAMPDGYEISDPGSYAVTAYDARNNRSEVVFTVLGQDLRTE